MRRLLLFDIDGTLMHSGGAGGRALVYAFKELFDLTDPLSGVRLHGQTDPQIFTDALAKAGIVLAPGDPKLSQLRALYLERLALEMPISAEARMMPGVIMLLSALAARDNLRMGLVTGNVEPGARIKLERFELNRYFPVGGFGSDSMVRRDLVPLAIQRAAEHFGEVFPPERVVVIGDTEKDVDCGRFAGARTVAVATGNVTAKELADCGADRVLADFSNTALTMSAILDV